MEAILGEDTHEGVVDVIDYLNYGSEKPGLSIEQLRRPQHVADLGRDNGAALYHSFGLETQRKKNLQLIDDRKLVYVVGNAVIFEDLDTGVKTYLLGLDEGGVGCVTVHPCKKIFAVGGRGYQPKIYIYTYPELKIVNVLTGGAERGYASLNFNVGGNKLASVASSPDYMLTVWDWQEERIALHAKAFGQDVFDVKFSIDDDRRLVSSGTGHIRFWKMASTFTGLKLQGYIGKFGKIELSDIQAFVELPDGKVLSGTETGALLLWEGNFIKCRFVQVNGQPCHAAEVTYVELDRVEKCVMTASVDGYIRWWDYSAIDAAEVDSDVTMDFELFPVAEYFLGPGNGVLTLVDGGCVGTTRTLVIVNKRGCIETLRFELGSRVASALDAPVDASSDSAISMEDILATSAGKIARLCDTVSALAQPSSSDALPVPPQLSVCSEFHAGSVMGLDCSPLELLVATAGKDGTVRCWDIASKKLLTTKTFSSSCSSLRWLPTTLDSTAKQILVGFGDGIVRLLMLGENDECKATWARKMVFKPHNGAVTDMRFNDQGTLLATAGKDGNVFLFNCTEMGGPNGSYTPLRFFVVNPSVIGGKPTSCERLCWSADSKRLLCSCSDLLLREVDVSDLLERVTSDVETYEFVFPMVEFSCKVQVMTASESKLLAPGSPSTSGASAPAENESSGETKEGEVTPELSIKDQSSSPSSPSRKGIKDAEGTEVPVLPLKVSSAIYSVSGSGSTANSSGIFAGATVGPRAYLYECIIGQENPEKELPLGVYSVEGKNAVKAPNVTSLTYSSSKRFLAVGTADGSVVVRPASHPEVFFRVAAHNGAVLLATLSYDDHFVISSGIDGTLQIHALLPGIDTKSEELFKNLDAGVYGDAIIKPLDTKPAPEPSYLSVISSLDSLPSVQSATAASQPAETLETQPQTDTTIGHTSIQAVALPHISSDNENLELPSGAYSIQDAKLKSEEDAKLLTADALKEKIRLIVKTLQRDYQRVVDSNSAIPEEVRVPAADLIVDGDVFELLRARGANAISEVHKEFAYEAEKARRLKEKISSFLAPDMLVEEITLKSLSKSGYSRVLVKSLRTQGISPTVRAICEKVRETLREEAIEEDKLRTEARLIGAGGANDVASAEEMVREDATADVEGGTAMGSKQGGMTHPTAGGSGPAHRREMRRQRKLRLKEHLKQKPNENDDDPRDLAAIAYAEKTMGVYNLKGGDDYEVPEGQRINAEKMRQHMALLEDSMVRVRMDFNDRFIALRDLKCDLIKSICASNKRIREIDTELLQPELSAGSALWEPCHDVTEFPDDRGEVTEVELERYMEERNKTQIWSKCAPVLHSGITNSKTKIMRSLDTGEYITSMIDLRERLNFGAVQVNEAEHGELLSSNAEVMVDLEIPLADTSKHLSGNADDTSSKMGSEDFHVNDNPLLAFVDAMPATRVDHVCSVVPVLQLTTKSQKLKMSLSGDNSFTLRAQSERRRLLEFERKRLLEVIDSNVSAFEEAVDELRVERQQLTGDLKQAELKLLSYFQAYQLLQQFESRDLALQQKHLKSVKESGEIRLQVSELEVKLDGKREELKHWQDKGVAVASEYRAVVPENHTYLDQLNKIFRRKIKRSKLGGDAGDAEEEDQEVGDEDEEDEDDEDAEDVCPVGCDPVVYEKVLELRGKRLDTDEATFDVQKGIDETRKALDRLKQRDKQVAKDVQMVELETRQFQKQKLSALNQIDVYVPLRLGQIYAFNSSGALTGPEPRERAVSAVPETDVGEQSEAELELAASISELQDPKSRQLVANMSIKSHVVVNNE